MNIVTIALLATLLSRELSKVGVFSEEISYTCPSGWDIYRKQCYLYVGESKNHAACREACLALGGDLLSLWNAAELNFIWNFIRVRIPSPGLLGWTGLKKSVGSDWTWTDGSQKQYFTWYLQPQESYTRDMCGAILGANAQLYPFKCSGLTSVFICKREAVVAYKLGLPWDTGNQPTNSSQGREATFHLTTDVDAVLNQVNDSASFAGRNEADCGLMCMRTPGCSAFVYKCNQATGCDQFECALSFL